MEPEAVSICGNGNRGQRGHEDRHHRERQAAPGGSARSEPSRSQPSLRSRPQHFIRDPGPWASNALPTHPSSQNARVVRGFFRTDLLMPGRLGQREIAVTGVEDQADVSHEIVDQDAALRDLGQRAVATVGHRPGGPAGGRCRVAALGAELAVIVLALQQLEGLGAQRGRGRPCRLLGLAAGVGGRALERAPSTSVSVVSPEWSWVTLKIAPPNVPVWVLLRLLLRGCRC